MREEVFDVVIVGGGGTGLAAAIGARAGGVTVVLVEKNSPLGGSTAWSIACDRLPAAAIVGDNVGGGADEASTASATR